MNPSNRQPLAKPIPTAEVLIGKRKPTPAPKEIKPQAADVTLLRTLRRDGAVPGGIAIQLPKSIALDRCRERGWIARGPKGFWATSAGMTILERTDFANAE